MIHPILTALALAAVCAAAPVPSGAPGPASPVAAQSAAAQPAPAPPWGAAVTAPSPPATTNTSSSLLPIDTAAVAAAERLLGSPRLTDAQRRGLYGDGLPYIPATLSTQLEAYARVRGVVAAGPETVAGGGHAPMALVYAAPEFKGVVRPGNESHAKAGGVGVSSVIGDDDALITSIAPDDVADDSANYVGDDAGATAAASATLASLPRLLTWACGSSCSVRGGGDPAPHWHAPARTSAPPARPSTTEALAYMTALDLGALVRARKVTAVELVQVFTARLKSLDPFLEAVAFFNTDAALAAARRLDAEAAAGRFRGPLHGVPFGVKDIIAAAGAPSTWGLRANESRAPPDVDATVVARLQDAGAILIAKLATGELTFDDVWWGGHTKNPWNIQQGASGSSAGPAAAVAAAGVPFALGTETQGSLVSPAAHCGVTAVRPTPGLIPRTGVMPLAESLDKVGPLCRSAADCATVLAIVRGADGIDPSARDVSTADPATIDLASLTVGILPSVRGKIDLVLRALRARGVTIVEADIKYVTPATDAVTTILLAEGGASFDYWMRSNAARTALRQDFWPSLFRLARFVPAPEYVAAQRARSVLAGELSEAFSGTTTTPHHRPIHAFIGNGTDLMAASNLVGLASVAAPLAHARVAGAAPTSRRRTVSSIGFFAPPYGDGVALALATAWQAASDAHLQRPPVGEVEDSVKVTACDARSRCRTVGSGGWWEGSSSNVTGSGGGGVPSAR